MSQQASAKFFIGIMSGTSLDGIDVCLVSFEPSITIQKSYSQIFSSTLKKKIKALTLSGDNEIERMAIAEPLLTKEYANAVKQLLATANISAVEIEAIGVHGQTIRHIPTSRDCSGYTLQLVDASLLAVLTGIPVVSDFRRKDIALGGQGAPLVPAFHQAVFSSRAENRVIINIGGIANISYLPIEPSQQLGFDTGPGNTLLDNWYQEHNAGSYDDAGEWARTGNISKTLLDQLLSDHYFSENPPKSTGPEYFNVAWLKPFLTHHKKLHAEDIQATLTELSAISIADTIKQYCDDSTAFVCGGGYHNHYLMERLANHLKANILTTEIFGINPDDVEAAAFAWLAKQRLEQLPGNLSAATGASRDAVLGSVYLAN